jgi:hypothetical protein
MERQIKHFKYITHQNILIIMFVYLLSRAGAYHFFMNQTHSVQILLLSLAKGPRLLNAGRKPQRAERNSSFDLRAPLLPERKHPAILISILPLKQ